MRIAINTRFLISSKMEGFGWYTLEIVKRIVENNPEHEFLLFFDRKYDKKFIFAENVKPIILSPQARHPFLFYIWFEFSIRNALKKYNADIFLSPDGYLSLGSTVKQISVIHDINFEHNPKDLPWLMQKYLRFFFPKFARKAEHILTVSEYSKKDICSTYNINKSKVTSIWNGASNHFKPLSEEEKQIVRSEYTNGHPYFLFVGAIHPRKNLERLISAFEKFKKNNLKSKHKLIIVGTNLFGGSQKKISISQFINDEIIFTGHLPLSKLARVMGSATIFTYVSYFEGFGIPLVEAMKCGTPILSGDRTSLPEVAGDCAIYCDPFNINDISEKLTSLANNSELQTELSQKGIKRSELFSWNKTANEIWNIICSITKE